MAELDLLTEIHSDVKYIKQTLSDHIVHDDRIAREFIQPLWEKHQQRKGAANLGLLISNFMGSVLTIIAGIFSGVIHK